MGNSVSIYTQIFGKREAKVFMFGADGAGKTTILYKMKLGDLVTTIPTIGFNMEKLDFPNISLDVCDIGGGLKLKQLWHRYAERALATIFVVDASDRENMEFAKKEFFQEFIPENEHRPLLVLANKQDILNCMNESEISEAFNLHKLSCKWNIQPCNAITGSGLAEGFDWLSKEIYKSLPWW